MPTFGWQRQTDTNMKRSVRFGGGLRVYLSGRWFSSGEGELLGVALWSERTARSTSTRDKFKPFFTQWGMDPIWQTAGLARAPGDPPLPRRRGMRTTLSSLEEASAHAPDGSPGRVDVVGFAPAVRPRARAVVRRPHDRLPEPSSSHSHLHALRPPGARPLPAARARDAQISRVVLAGFAQLTPDRAAMVTADPYHPRTLRVVVSGRGAARTGAGRARPLRSPRGRRTSAYECRSGQLSAATWAGQDAPAAEAAVTQFYEGQGLFQPDLSCGSAP